MVYYNQSKREKKEVEIMSKMSTDARDMSMALTNLSFYVPSIRIGQVMDDFHVYLKELGIDPFYLPNEEYVGSFRDFCARLIKTSC